MFYRPNDHVSFIQECLKKAQRIGWNNVVWDTFLPARIDSFQGHNAAPLPPIKHNNYVSGSWWTAMPGQWKVLVISKQWNRETSEIQATPEFTWKKKFFSEYIIYWSIWHFGAVILKEFFLQGVRNQTFAQMDKLVKGRLFLNWGRSCLCTIYHYYRLKKIIFVQIGLSKC